MESKFAVEPSNRSRLLGLSGIRAIFERAQKIPDVIRLEFGEPDFDTPDNIKGAAVRAINAGKTKYTSSAGMPELRNAISSKLKTENRIDYDPKSEVVVSAGATQAINLALLATADPGDEILVPNPGWATYSYAVSIVGAIPVPYPLLESDGYSFQTDKAHKLVTPNTKGILINSPSNPIGSVLTRKNQKDIAEFAIKNNLFVYSDEVYEKFIYPDSIGDVVENVSIASLPEMKDRTVTMNAFSKTYSMTGWRIGYVAAPESITSAMAKINAAQSSCVSTISQYAALEALTGPQDSVSKMIAAFSRRREVLVRGLNEFPQITCSVPRGAFFAFPNIRQTGYSSQDLALKIIDNAHVAVVPGSAFGSEGEGYIRVAYANSLENIEAALGRMRKVLT